MCSLPSAPPLPPEVPHLISIAENKSTYNLPEEDARISSALLDWTDPSQIYLASWRTPPTILQQGPQCGLVALAMGAQMLGYDIHQDSLLYEAKLMGLTKQGEMFSANWMSALARKVKLPAAVLEGGLNDHFQVLNYLTRGKPLLVPYDADFNHSPCKKKGHKAHWALIFGFIVVGNSFCTSPSVSMPSDQSNCLLKGNIRRLGQAEDIILQNLEKREIFLLAKQGKSRHTGIWNYMTIEESNKNLVEIDPKRSNPDDYVLPTSKNLCELNDKILVME